MLSENSRDQLHKLSNTPHSETKRRRNWLSIFENVSYMRKIKPVLEISLEFKLPIRIVEMKFIAVINHSKNAASLTSFSQTITVGSEDHWSESIPTKSVVLDRNRSALRRDRLRESFHQAKRTNVYRFWWEETVWIGSVMTRTVRIEQERERALASSDLLKCYYFDRRKRGGWLMSCLRSDLFCNFAYNFDFTDHFFKTLLQKVNMYNLQN